MKNAIYFLCIENSEAVLVFEPSYAGLKNLSIFA
jgi:hypothetical protein